jgi:uncharacterized membrane protein YkvA (DUF1232 family)
MRQLKRLARTMILQLPNVAVLLSRLLRDPRVSTLDKALVGAVLAYVVAPVDIVPDFVQFLGLVDDGYLVAIVLGRLLSNAGVDVLLEHWKGDPHDLGYLVGSVEQVGTMLPDAVRRMIAGVAQEETPVA